MNLLVLSALALGVLGNESSKPERLDPEQNQKARLATFHWRWILSGEQMAPENAQALVFAGFGLVNRDLIVKEEAGEAHFVVTPPFTRPEEQGPSASTMESKLFGSVEAELPLKAQKDYSLNWYPVPSPQLSSQFPEPDARSPTKGPSETSAPGVPQHVLPFQNRLIFLGVTRSGNLVLQSEKDPRKLFELDLWATVEHGVKQRPFPKPRSEAIRVERAGGYIYLRLGSTMDGYKLSEPKVQNLTQYSLTAHLFESPPPDPPLPPAVESSNLQEPPAQTTAGVARATATSPPPRPQTVLPPPETEVADSTVRYSQFSHRKPPQTPLTDATSVKAAESSDTVPVDSEVPSTDVHDVGVPSPPADRPTRQPADLETANDSAAAEADTQSSLPGTLDDSVAAEADTHSSSPGTLDDSVAAKDLTQSSLPGTLEDSAKTDAIGQGTASKSKRRRTRQKNRQKRKQQREKEEDELLKPVAPYWGSVLGIAPFPRFESSTLLRKGIKEGSLAIRVRDAGKGSGIDLGAALVAHWEVGGSKGNDGPSGAGPSAFPQANWQFMLLEEKALNRKNGLSETLLKPREFISKLRVTEENRLIKRVEEQLFDCYEIEENRNGLVPTDVDGCRGPDLFLVLRIGELLEGIKDIWRKRTVWWREMHPIYMPFLGFYGKEPEWKWPGASLGEQLSDVNRERSLPGADWENSLSEEYIKRLAFRVLRLPEVKKGKENDSLGRYYDAVAAIMAELTDMELVDENYRLSEKLVPADKAAFIVTRNFVVYPLPKEVSREKAGRDLFKEDWKNDEEFQARGREIFDLAEDLHDQLGANYVGWLILRWLDRMTEDF